MKFHDYLKIRLEETKRRLGLENLEIRAAGGDPFAPGVGVYPITFSGRNFGAVIEIHATERKPSLADVAAEWSCLFASPAPERAVEIDAVVDELARLRPDRYHWTGVYLLEDSKTLRLEAFRGEATPHTIIPINRGLCGAAVSEGRTINVADVSEDSRYLSCSIKTKSEIVVPINAGGRIIGEIDIDSHVKNAFGEEDEVLIEGYCRRIAAICGRA